MFSKTGSSNRLSIETAPPAAPGPGEVLVRVHRVGICGTDYSGYLGKMPFYWKGGGPSLGIADAARGMLAAEKAGTIGQRYIFAERWLSYRELFEMAATASGRKAPVFCVPDWLLCLAAGISDTIARLRGRDSKVSVASIKCSKLLPDVDASLARTALQWEPRPIEESVREAVDYYLAG